MTGQGRGTAGGAGGGAPVQLLLDFWEGPGQQAVTPVRTVKDGARQVPALTRDAAAGRLAPQGDTVPFEAVYDRFARKLAGAAATYTAAARARGWAADLDDALQVARMALWECWRRDPRCGRGFAALVEKATHRRLTNWLRRQVPMIRGAAGGDGGPPAAVYSLDALMEADPVGWENRVRPLGEVE